MPQFLLTGATGFIGSEVLARLLREVSVADVFVLVRKVPEGEASLLGRRLQEHGLQSLWNRLNFVVCDFLNEGTFPQVLEKNFGSLGDLRIAHLAAQIAVKGSDQASLHEQERMNVGVTRDLMSFSNRVSKLFVFTSSVVAFGGTRARWTRTEKDFEVFPSEARTFSYFTSKRQAHEMVAAESRVPTWILCPGIVHGSMDAFKDSRAHLKAARDGRFRWVPAGSGSFVGLDRVAGAHVSALMANAPVAAGVNTRLLVDEILDYRDYINLYLECWGAGHRVRALPHWLGAPAFGALKLARGLGADVGLLDKFCQAALHLRFQSGYPEAPTEGFRAQLARSVSFARQLNT